MIKKIEKLIKSEAIIARRKARKPKPKKRKAKSGSKSSFYNKKGDLQNPVKNGRIIGKFGKAVHPDFNQLITQNNGIDIQGKQGDKILCVHQGEVVSVFSIPGMNYAVMVKHGDYYTTYSNLNNVFVKTGESVHTGTKIGVIGRSSNNKYYTLHFEIWRGKRKENPINWLKN